MSDLRPPTPLNPARATPAELAAALTREGLGPITEDMIRADLAAGAPANPDGSIALPVYLAWLIREGGRRHGD